MMSRWRLICKKRGNKHLRVVQFVSIGSLYSVVEHHGRLLNKVYVQVRYERVCLPGVCRDRTKPEKYKNVGPREVSSLQLSIARFVCHVLRFGLNQNHTSKGQLLASDLR